MARTGNFIAVSMMSLLQAGQAFPQAAAVRMEATKNSVPMMEVFRRSTVSLGTIVTINGKEQFSTAGSAIIVSDSPDRGCVLTALHMFFDPPKGWMPTQLNLRYPPMSADEAPNNGIVIKLVHDGKNLWTAAPNGADLAVIPLPKYEGDHMALSLRAFGNDSEIFQGASILALGYPALLGEDFLTTPYARGGIISWVDITDPAHKPFLVDANLYPGNSGGPVFRVRTGQEPDGGFVLGGGAALIGIVSKGAVEAAAVVAGGMPIQATNTQTGKVDPAVAMVLGIGGIGIIEPVSRASSIIHDCLHPAASIPSTGAKPDGSKPN